MGLELYRQLRKQFLDYSTLRDGSWVDDRSWNKASAESKDTYHSFLPKYLGKNAMQWISQKVSEKGDDTAVLDVGCGLGLFLADVKAIFPTIRLQGTTLVHFKDVSADVPILSVPFPRLPYISKFDVVVSVQALRYAHNPWFQIKQIYKSLKLDGIGLLAHTRINKESLSANSSVDVELFIQNLEVEYGLIICSDENNSIIIRKKRERLKLPVQLDLESGVPELILSSRSENLENSGNELKLFSTILALVLQRLQR